ncbi:HlyD family secretion protein [Anaerotalea alkaliphila]|nr:HlyD family efflux transporter periplasmic adaptor subunit [Anaerotalea alkaliphila]
MLKRKWLVILLLAVVAVSGVLYFQYQARQPLAVDTYKPEPETYEAYYYEEGVAKVKDKKDVYSTLGGKVAQVHVEEGQTIALGAPVLTLDTADLAYQLRYLQAQKAVLEGEQRMKASTPSVSSQLAMQNEKIRLAKERADYLAARLEEQKILAEEGIIPLQEIQSLERELTQALDQVDLETLALDVIRESGTPVTVSDAAYYKARSQAIDLEMQEVRKQMERMVQTSNAAGKVETFDIRPGDYVGLGQHLMEVVVEETLEVEVFVPTDKVRTLAAGDAVVLEVKSGQQTEIQGGLVVEIGDKAQEMVSTLGLVEKKVSVKVEPAGGMPLIEGEAVDVKFTTYRRERAVVLSRDYLFPWEQGEALWLLEEGKAKIQPVELLYTTSTIAVLDGDVAAGWEIILPPYPDKLAEGMEVQGK